MIAPPHFYSQFALGSESRKLEIPMQENVYIMRSVTSNLTERLAFCKIPNRVAQEFKCRCCAGMSGFSRWG